MDNPKLTYIHGRRVESQKTYRKTKNLLPLACSLAYRMMPALLLIAAQSTNAEQTVSPVFSFRQVWKQKRVTASNVFSAMRADFDGLVDIEQIARLASELGESFDVDADGKLEGDEMLGLQESVEAIENGVDHIGGMADGKVDTQEWLQFWEQIGFSRSESEEVEPVQMILKEFFATHRRTPPATPPAAPQTLNQARPSNASSIPTRPVGAKRTSRIAAKAAASMTVRESIDEQHSHARWGAILDPRLMDSVDDHEL